MLPDVFEDVYDKRFEKPREQWLGGYFNWTDEKDITKAERHTARDGFDAGANWAARNLLEIMRATTPEDRLDVMRMFCRGCGDLDPQYRCQCQNDE